MAHLDDTCVLHRGGPAGLRAVQAGARAVLAAGGCGTRDGQAALRGARPDLCLDRRLSPGGSGDLLSATLFLDALEREDVRAVQTLTYHFPADRVAPARGAHRRRRLG